jgi:hypothetical protein|tara:strand:- start:170708 stop:171292 length:585 start_codon:yes stop_codon:yes gene_type:complete
MDKNVLTVDFTGREIDDLDDDYPNLQWIEAGIKILREYGPRSVSIDALCTEIKQEPKDFNKAFNGLESYLFAVLDYWYEKETLNYIDIMDQVGGTAEENMMTMVEILHHADKRDEIAIRNWALMCPNAHKALSKVDRTRLDVGIGLFREMGFSETESKMKAKILYTSTIGTEYTSISSSLEQKQAMCTLLMQRD